MLLFRRFMIICLIAMNFAFGMAVLVEQASRPARSWEIGQVVPCVMKPDLTCGVPRR
ncbi:MAG: hypothetical protein H6891_08655 [Brucellaceae bacterium]|nr:hypothetical protein [Brucellaceae bacterium]